MVERAKEDLKKILVILNNHLLLKTYLVGEQITLADVIVVCNLTHLYEYYMDENNRKPFQNLNRWFETCINQPEFKAILGDFKICLKEVPVDPKKFTEFQSKFAILLGHIVF